MVKKLLSSLIKTDLYDNLSRIHQKKNDQLHVIHKKKKPFHKSLLPWLSKCIENQETFLIMKSQ